MTTQGVLAALRRRWYVALLGVFVTLCVVAPVMKHPGVYWSQTDAVLRSPPTPVTPNNIQDAASGLIAMAGLLEREVNQGHEAIATATSVSLVGQGIREGSSVELPNAGGQWAYNFSEPVLDVQVAGSSPEQVRARFAEVDATIHETLAKMQSDDGVKPEDQVTLQLSPAQPQVYYSEGNPNRAIVVTLMLGLSFTIALTVGFDGWMRRRQHARQPERARVRAARLQEQ